MKRSLSSNWLVGCSVPAAYSVFFALAGCSAASSEKAGGTGIGAGSSGAGGSVATSMSCGESKTYACMTPQMLEAIPREAPGQWTYHQIDGAVCRDGSPAGFYTRFSDTSTKLLIYLEQGGACFNSALCMYNPATVSDSLTGRTLTEAISGLHPGVMQQPQTTGIFDYANPENPYKDWNAVWIPYCTGDAFGGSNPNGAVPGVDGTQHFVGHLNMQKFVGHIVPTWNDATEVVLTGTSAGSFGAGLNYNMVQDAFGSVPVTVIMDSGLPFSDEYMAPCLQQQWRDLWKVDELLPPDCSECTQSNGGGFLNLVFYTAKKYPHTKLGIISANEDDIMKFFYGFGENNCQNGNYATGKYPAALADLRQSAAQYRSQFASYFITGINHMYSQFPDFYEPMAGGVTLVSWVDDVLAGTMNDVGP